MQPHTSPVLSGCRWWLAAFPLSAEAPHSSDAPAAPRASKRARPFINTGLQSALRICSSPLRQMMARSDLGGTSGGEREGRWRGGWIKPSWSLPITARVWSPARTTEPHRGLYAHRTPCVWGGNQADRERSLFPFFLPGGKKSQTTQGWRKTLRFDSASTAKTARALVNSFRWH